MKKTLHIFSLNFLILLVCFFLTHTSKAQLIEDTKEITDEYEMDLNCLSAYGENNLFVKQGSYVYHFGGRIDLNNGFLGIYYKIGFGANANGKVYMHLPLGLQAAVVLGSVVVQNGLDYYLFLPVVLCALVPEGITVRFWQRNNYNLKFYLSPWGSELNIVKEHFTLVSGEAGIQATVLNHGRYTLSCYAGAKVLYKNIQPAATIGATVGILLD